MILDTVVVTNRLRALAHDAGMSLKLESGTPHTDGKSITLNPPSWDWDKDKLTQWEGDAYHELGHCVPENRDAFQLLRDKGVSMNTRLGGAWNCLEDLKQEHNQLGQYMGRDRVMDESCLLDIKAHSKAGSGVFDDTGDPDTEFVQSTFGYMYYKYPEMYPSTSGFYEKVVEKFPPKVQENIQALVDNDDKINPYGKTSAEVYECAKQMLEVLGYDAEEEERNAQKAKADQEDAEKQLSEAAKKLAEEMGHRHSDEGVEGRAQQADEQEAGDTGKGGGPDRKFNVKAGEEYKRTPDFKADYNDYQQTDWSAMKIRDYSVKPARAQHIQQIKTLVDKGMFLGTHVRKLLQALSQSRYRHGLRRGRVGKNIHRVTVPDGGKHAERIFKKKETTMSLDTSITLLVDCSGSMAGGKYYAAAASATIMSNVLTQLRIPHEVLGFTETWASTPVLHHAVFKSFDRAVSQEQLMYNFEDFSDRLEQNLDGESIMWAASRLLKRRSERKLLIVFSDGSPASHTSGAGYITEKAIKELEARRDMEIYGVGIKDRSVKHYYSECQTIKNTGELEKALLDIIKLKIINK